MADEERDLPELATNKDWRGIMKRARASHDNMSQGELASRVRRLLNADVPSQAMISKIESGVASASTFITPICQVLGIALPEHFVDKAERDWVRLGRVIRAQGMEKFLRTLATVEDLANSAPAERAGENGPTYETKPTDSKSPKREKRPAARK